MVERSDRNPNCSRGRRLFVSRKFFRRLERIFSKIFPAMFRKDIGRYGKQFVESLLNLGIMTLVACFQVGGSGGYALNSSEPQGRSVFQQLNEGFHLVRKTLDNERVVFRERAEKMVGGLRRKFLTLLVTCMKKASSHLQ
jgi:hypothetical protein